MKEEFKLVEIGFGGSLAHVNRNCTVSGWRSAEESASQMAEGAYIIDKRPALDSEGTGYPDAQGISRSIMAPMVDVDLTAADVTRFPEVPAIMLHPEFGLQGEFRSLALLGNATAQDAGPGPLDYVSIDDHVARWASWGARIGRKINGELVWIQ